METSREQVLITLTINYKSASHSLSLPAQSSLSSLRDSITALTRVDPSKQKLLPSPKPKSGLWIRVTQGKGPDEADHSLEELGLKDGMKILTLGPQSSDLQELDQYQKEIERRNTPRKLHPSLLRGAKVSASSSLACKLPLMTQADKSVSPADLGCHSCPLHQPRSTARPTKTVFHALQVHSTTPPNTDLHSKIIAYLERLSSDPAILHVCNLHSYTVGVLTELLPHEHPNLLGLNENKGQRILLRIRTDDYQSKGLRDYKTTRRVLLHELAHIDVSDHNRDFKELNSLLNKQVLEFEADSRGEALEEGDFYQPSAARAGGDLDEEREERRIRVLRATMSRLAKEEKEIEIGCGNDGPGVGGSAALERESL